MPSDRFELRDSILSCALGPTYVCARDWSLSVEDQCVWASWVLCRPRSFSLGVAADSVPASVLYLISKRLVALASRIFTAKGWMSKSRALSDGP